MLTKVLSSFFFSLFVSQVFAQTQGSPTDQANKILERRRIQPQIDKILQSHISSLNCIVIARSDLKSLELKRTEFLKRYPTAEGRIPELNKKLKEIEDTANYTDSGILPAWNPGGGTGDSVIFNLYESLSSIGSEGRQKKAQEKAEGLKQALRLDPVLLALSTIYYPRLKRIDEVKASLKECTASLALADFVTAFDRLPVDQDQSWIQLRIEAINAGKESSEPKNFLGSPKTPSQSTEEQRERSGIHK